MTVATIPHVAALQANPVDEGREPSSWRLVDLTDALAGIGTPPPDLFARGDGIHLLYRGKTHWFQGESESCKSWAAQVAVAQVLGDGGRVLYIDFEDDAEAVVGRLLALAVDPVAIRARFGYVRPEEPLFDDRGRATGGLVDLLEILDSTEEAGRFDLVVIDGVTEAMTTEGLDLLSNADIAVWLRRLPKRLANTGAAVVCIDHVTKNAETRGRYSIGGQHKLAGVTGATYVFTAERPLSRADHDPVTGVINMRVEKDRPGFVRGKSAEGKVAVLELTAYPDGGVSWRLIAPADDATTPAPPIALLRRITDYLVTYDGISGRQIAENVEGKTDTIRAALKWMADHGWVTVKKVGSTQEHWLTDAGREGVL
jgi:hypothetical protein